MTVLISNSCAAFACKSAVATPSPRYRRQDRYTDPSVIDRFICTGGLIRCEKAMTVLIFNLCAAFACKSAVATPSPRYRRQDRYTDPPVIYVYGKERRLPLFSANRPSVFCPINRFCIRLQTQRRNTLFTGRRTNAALFPFIRSFFHLRTTVFLFAILILSKYSKIFLCKHQKNRHMYYFLLKSC